MTAMEGVRAMGRARKPRTVTDQAVAVANDDSALPNDDAPFPDDEPKPEQQPAELAHALVGPDRVDNYDRLSRQREAFGDVASDAPAAPAPLAPVQAPRRPAPRRVSAEVVKAETALINLERRAEISIDTCRTSWQEKRVALIKSFAPDVLAALQAMAILDAEDAEMLRG